MPIMWGGEKRKTTPRVCQLAIFSRRNHVKDGYCAKSAGGEPTDATRVDF